MNASPRTSSRPNPRAIRRQSLPEAIAGDLRERILSGELAEGTPIRQEALAEEYEVSRMPVREALKQLDAEGLVLLATNRGATVIKHSLREIGEIFDLRILIEVDLFRRAIPLMKPADFDRCEMLLAEMERSYEAGDVGSWGAQNHTYHAALCAAAGRRLSDDFLSRLGLHADRYVRMHLSVMNQLEQARTEHRQLMTLAREGKVDAACALLADHIGRTKEQLLARVAANRAREAREKRALPGAPAL